MTTLTPRKGATGTHLIYTHGGCYIYAMIPAYWTILETLIRNSGVTVTVPHYGLAPRHRVDEAYELLTAVYTTVSASSDRVFLAGDSAGGGLALGQALRYRETPPAGIILFSPLVDATLSNPAIPELASRDRQLGPAGLAAAAEWWAGERSVADPLLSPLLGDLSALPPIWIYQGGNDILAADAKLLAEKTGAHLVFEPKAFHDYVGAPWTPEARRALAEVAEILRARTGGDAAGG